ncbi:MAG TPA: Rossmann-like and DUF2520 domain-containing protein [Verrucomicrobiae bacterium]|nr:Rossmann-like and DUF2520 domain-containing protein [Verrucomicrobiae bacterium]
MDRLSNRDDTTRRTGSGVCYASAMPQRPRIAVVGAGNLGGALARSLHRAGYAIDCIVTRPDGPSRTKARKLAQEVGARVCLGLPADLHAHVVWFTVPDAEIARTARDFADAMSWKGRIALHSSGALGSDELDALRRRGASVASAHPLMTFVRGSQPSFAGVPFAIEGNAAAVRLARRTVKDFGADSHPIRRKDKAAYHAWGTFVSPLFTSLLATSEEVAFLAGVKKNEARRRSLPILLQTLANYARFGASDAFSGPLIRGDVDTVRKHLRSLAKNPAAREVYRALAYAALAYLPVKNRQALEKTVRSGRN